MNHFDTLVTPKIHTPLSEYAVTQSEQGTRQDLVSRPGSVIEIVSLIPHEVPNAQAGICLLRVLGKQFSPWEFSRNLTWVGVKLGALVVFSLASL